jgi:hypothetical protein
MPLFERSLELPVPAAEAFAWHAREGAFERLKPPWQHLEVRHRDGPLENGSRVTFTVYQGPLPLPWVAEHRDVVPGEGFRDVQVRGPFKRWDHHHRFEDLGDGTCRLVDRIDYRLPLAPLSSLVAGGTLRNDLDRLFRYRHRITAEDLESHRHYRTPKPLRVAIAGAGGLVGGALSAFLTTGGHRVLRLVRRPARGEAEVEWNPERGVIEPRRLEGLDALVYLAGEPLDGGRWTERRKERLVSSRVHAVARLGDSLAGLDDPPKALFCASGIGYYGDGGEDELDESSPTGEGFLAELARRWEEAAEHAADGWGARAVLLRLGVVLSPAGGALAKLLPPFRCGLGGPLGSGRQYLSWIGLDDTLDAILHLLVNPSLEGPFDLCSPHPARNHELATTMGRILQRPTVLRVPATALELALGPMARETLLVSQRAVPRRLLESGFRFRQPGLEEALRAGLGL